ncbi:cell wall-binding repeat-containing protein [Clostridium sp. WILCCON 0269]|uniref:Cell wall-binding repeat-containing protein n=1 Tax=Candidatus Clostridium eludens TaxID=3381663 RepID=A0ABW8SGJ5_9CLOT
MTLVNGQDFPDALDMSPFSAKKTMPILFTDKDSLRTDTLQSLKSWGIKNVIIAGGTGVVSEQVERQLQALGINITRLAGQDRYATGLEILKYFRPDTGYKDIAIASGENFPDALTGAVLSSKLDIPLVIVSHAGASEDTIKYLSGDPINKAYIFGGSAVVDKGVVTN